LIGNLERSLKDPKARRQANFLNGAEFVSLKQPRVEKGGKGPEKGEKKKIRGEIGEM